MARAVGPEWRRAAAHLEQLANAHKTVQMARGIDQCVRILTPEVQRRAPVGATGRLRRSIKGETGVEAQKGLRGVVYTNLFYSLFVERGTYGSWVGPHRRRHGRKTTRRGSRARKFFEGAWRAKERQCRRILGDVVGKLVAGKARIGL